MVLDWAKGMICFDLYKDQHILVWYKGVSFYGGTAKILIEAAIA